MPAFNYRHTKNELGFDELLLLTGKILYLYTRHKVAENNREAVKIAIMAGIDKYGT
jgi:beta-glucosidase